jgi:predicted regulator of Ras-like GTPase activity (Roadblock/LC7/MglB family)
MSFEEILRGIVSQCPGCVGVALMGADGVPIAEVGGAGESDEVTLLGIEFGRVLDEARKVASTVNGGELEELVIAMARTQVVMRAVDPETLFVLALDPSGNLGKARYLLRRHVIDVREQL